MLGKTNILATKESSVITYVEEFHWKAMNISSEGLERAIYNENTGILVVVTSGGTILWSSDGETWESKSFENTVLTDVIWDGSRYVFVGYAKTNGSGIIITSEKLSEFNHVIAAQKSGTWYLGIYCKNGEYTVICYCPLGTYGKLYAYNFTKNFDTYKSYEIRDCSTGNENTQICMGKNTDGFLIGVKTKSSSSLKNMYANVYMTRSGTIFTDLASVTDKEQNWDIDRFYVFECKGELYYAETADTYRIQKVTDMTSEITVSAGKKFLFRTAVYFNESRVYFNGHEMLVLKKNEMMADKEMEDLVEVSYEHTISQAVKAWGKIVLLCENGNILVSSAETEDPGAVVVKTLSAKQALYEAKKYTDSTMEEMLDGISLSITEDGNLVARKGDRVFQISATEI